MSDQQDFFEEDQPLEQVLAAFENGVQGVTVAPPVREASGQQLASDYFLVFNATVIRPRERERAAELVQV